MSIKKLLLFLIIACFLTNNVFANNEYFQCNEKITKVRSSQSLEYSEGKNNGYSLIKLGLNSKSPVTTIHFKSTNTTDKISELVKNRNTKNTTLGFDLEFQTSKKDFGNYDIKYSFIKVNDTYAYTKKIFSWLKKENKSYDYDASSRCKKINKEKYLRLTGLIKTEIKKKNSYNWSAISKHPKSDKDFIATKLSTKKKAINLAIKKCYKFVTKNLNKIGYNDCYLSNTSNGKISKNYNQNKKEFENINNKISGKRIFALSWEGIDELIIGKLTFDENNMIGRINFNYPKDGSLCIGTYILSTKKGTWSLLCEEQQKNASGILEWDNQTGDITGNGKDSKGNELKFKVTSIN